MQSISASELGGLRLAAQRLVGEGFASAPEAVQWMTCLQGQDFPGVLNSVALRTAGRNAASVESAQSALADGSVVRSWPMRGTLHLVPAEDLGWMLAVAARRGDRSRETRRAQLGISDQHLETAAGLLGEFLDDGHIRDRAEIMDLWAGAGIDITGGRAYHLLVRFAIEGLICQANEGTVHGFARYDRWLARHGRAVRELDPQSATAEWLERYLRSHGPARPKDFQWWTGLPLREIRPAMAAVEERLTAVECGGDTYWMDPETPGRLADAGSQAKAVLLLPGFDEYLLGYGDRSHAVPVEHANRIVPGGNGVFRRTVVHKSTVVGTWASVGSGSKRRCEVEAFAPLTKVQAAGVERAFRNYPG